MSKLLSILKYTAIDNLNLNKYYGKNKTVGTKKTILGIIGIIGMLVLIEAMITMYTGGIWSMFEKYKITKMIIPFSMIIASLCVFMTTINKAQGILFASRDYELLTAMPIKSSTILVAKIAYLLIINYLFTLLITLPATVMYFIAFGGGIIYFINYLILLIFMPLLPILIASIVSFIISYISTIFKHKNAVTTILSIMFLCVVMVVSFNAQSYIEGLSQNIQVVNNAINMYYPVASYYTNVLTNGNMFELVIYIVTNLLSFGIFIFLLSKLFRYINMKLKETPKSAIYNEKKLKVSKPIFALYKKELKRYFSSPIYVMNTAFGLVLLLAGGIGLVFFSGDFIKVLDTIPEVKSSIGPLIIAAICFMIATSNSTDVSFSIEGKNLWISKSMPIKMQDIYLSKLLVPLTLTLPVIIIFSLFVGISLNMDILTYMLMIIIPTLFTIFMGLIGLVLNLHFPKFDAKSDTVIIKQSFSAFIGVLIGMFFVIIACIIYVFVSFLTFNIYAMIIIALLVIGSLITWKYLNKGGEKLYRKFNV